MDEAFASGAKTAKAPSDAGLACAERGAPRLADYEPR